MDIDRKHINIRALCQGFQESGEDGADGVRGYGGKLNIRPPYQREFVYDDKKRNAVIESVRRGFPLNVMYWAEQERGVYNMLDGQQRTISICKYVDEQFAVLDQDRNPKYFSNLSNEEKEKLLDYELMIYVCRGSHQEQLKWFEIINIAGEKLYPQEMLNAIYNGPWVIDAKKLFSRSGCVGQGLGGKYVKGNIKRQELLATAIKWKCGKEPIQEFMAKHQHKKDANELWLHFQKVIHWVKETFPEHRDIMKGVDWGRLHAEHSNNVFKSDILEKKIVALCNDSDVTNPKGIYEYLLTNDEWHLSIRLFDRNMKWKQYEKQERRCGDCQQESEFKDMHAHHIVPWSKGGHTTEDNLRMLCQECHHKQHRNR